MENDRDKSKKPIQKTAKDTPIFFIVPTDTNSKPHKDTVKHRTDNIRKTQHMRDTSMMDFLKLMSQQIPIFIEIKKFIDQTLELPYFKEIALISSIPGTIAIVAIIKKIYKWAKYRP